MKRLFFALAAAGGLFAYLAIPALLVMGPVHWYFGLSWAASIALFTLFLLTLKGQRWITAAATLIFAAFNTALAISFLTQGVAFNTAFFTHLDLSTFRIALATDGARLAIAVLYIACAPLLALWCAGKWRALLPTGRWRAIAATLTLVLASLTSYPLQAIGLHQLLTRQSSDRMLAEIQSLQTAAPNTTPEAAATKNLVLVYLEGFEQNYLDPSLFPGLTPNLTRLRDGAIWFDNLQQYPGTGWTVGGIVSSQCGVPLLSDGNGNQILGSLNNPFHQITCLAEFLQDDGYRNIYLGGATLKFAGKGQFLADNGYGLTLGIDELPKATRHKWGMYDNDLFAHARDLFDGLAAESAPFLLTLLTLDTHHPIGTPSPGCPSYGTGDDPMLTAIHCSDTMVTAFLDHIATSPVAENTVVALVSDHLLIHGAPKTTLSQKDRRLTFILVDPSRPAGRKSGAATHFDVAPTLLEAVGRKGVVQPFGHSLLDHPKGRVFSKQLTDKDFQGFKIESLVTESDLADGISYVPDNDQVDIGHARFFARDANEVHKGSLFEGRKARFLALVFETMQDAYPRMFLQPDTLSETLNKQETGFVVVASDGGRFCLTPQICDEGRFLTLYDLSKKTALGGTSSNDTTTELVISPAQIAKFVDQTP